MTADFSWSSDTLLSVGEMRPTAADNAIRADRVRKLVRVFGELRELGIGEAARTHLLRALMSDLGAAVGGVVLDGEYRIGKTNSIEAATLFGFDEASARVFAIHQVAGSDIKPYHRVMMEAPSLVPGEVRSAGDSVKSDRPLSKEDHEVLAIHA